MSQNGCKIQLSWLCADGLLRHLLELWLVSFFPLLPNGICAKTSHHTQVISLQWVTNAVLCAEMSNRHSHYFCLVLWRNAHLCTSLKFSFWEGNERNAERFYLGEGLSVEFFFCLWPLGLEKHQLKMDASLWHSSRSLAWGFFLAWFKAFRRLEIACCGVPKIIT